MKNIAVTPLSGLMEADRHAVEHYTTALERITDPVARERLVEFRGHHRHHITELESLISDENRVPEAGSWSVESALDGILSLRSFLGTHQALQVLLREESQVVRTYSAAISSILSDEERKVVLKNYLEEARHQSWLKEMLGQSPDAQAQTP
jgi:rubrerythrin